MRREQKEVKRLYYGNKQFKSCDNALSRLYRLSNPYRICRKFLQTLGEKEVDLYGETPLTGLEKIAREASLGPQDHLFELGCGRGRGAFFLAHHIGCHVTGIEWVPEFINKAKKIKSPSHLSFRCEDMFACDFKGATAIYLYGTCLEDHSIHKLISSFKNLPTGTKFITVSYPLSDYSSQFRLIKTFSINYPWGEADVFLQVKSAKDDFNAETHR